MDEIATNILRALNKAGAADVTVELEEKGRGIPRFLKWQYDHYTITLGDERWLGAYVKYPEELRPAQYEKHAALLRNSGYAGVCLIAETLPYYIRERLIARGLPFIVPELQMYWPEFGLSLKRHSRRSHPRSVEALSPLTQVSLISILTSRINRPVSVKDVAALLGSSSMSASRILDELNANDLVEVVREGRERMLLPPTDLAALWEHARQFMRDPCKYTVIIPEMDVPEENRIIAGLSALSTLTMLNPPEFPTYAITTGTWKQLRETGVRTLPIMDEGSCVMQIWRYDPEPLAVLKRVDLFSLYISLQSETDERIQSACEEMMRKFKWS